MSDAKRSCPPEPSPSSASHLAPEDILAVAVKRPLPDTNDDDLDASGSSELGDESDEVVEAFYSAQASPTHPSYASPSTFTRHNISLSPTHRDALPPPPTPEHDEDDRGRSGVIPDVVMGDNSNVNRHFEVEVRSAAKPEASSADLKASSAKLSAEGDNDQTRVKDDALGAKFKNPKCPHCRNPHKPEVKCWPVCANCKVRHDEDAKCRDLCKICGKGHDSRARCFWAPDEKMPNVKKASEAKANKGVETEKQVAADKAKSKQKKKGPESGRDGRGSTQGYNQSHDQGYRSSRGYGYDQASARERRPSRDRRYRSRSPEGRPRRRDLRSRSRHYRSRSRSRRRHHRSRSPTPTAEEYRVYMRLYSRFSSRHSQQYPPVPPPPRRQRPSSPNPADWSVEQLERVLRQKRGRADESESESEAEKGKGQGKAKKRLRGRGKGRGGKREDDKRG